MDSSRCVVIELGSQDEIPLLRYLTKNKEQYNWIFGETDKTRACVWWMKNVEFSTTPLRSVLKRLKSKSIKDSGSSHLKISRKMSSKDGVLRVVNNIHEVLQNWKNQLNRSVREVIMELNSEIKEPDNEIKEPKIEEPKVEEDPNRVNISTKLDLLLKITARIATQVKKLSQPVQPEVVEVMEDTSSSIITESISHPVQPEVVEVMDDTTSLTTHVDESSRSVPSMFKFCNRDR